MLGKASNNMVSTDLIVKTLRYIPTFSRGERFQSCVIGALSTFMALLIVQVSLLQAFYIPTSSMAPTLEPNDFVVVPKLAYGLRLPFFEKPIVSWRSPERGEVVVVTRQDDPATSQDESQNTLVKRVIGVAGDTVAISGTSVSVNGASLREDYAIWSKGGLEEGRLFVVPSGALFLLGDNRDESYDSRYWSQPFVSTDQVVGPAAMVYWSATSLDRAGRVIR